MTEQEVEVLAARLTRVWHPESVTWSVYDWVVESELHPGIAYESQLDVERDIRLRAHITLSAPFFHILLFLPSSIDTLQDCGGDCLWFGEEVELNQGTDAPTEETRQLVEQHLPTFRRNCWLSGVPIEATAHEKAEWVRGLSHEEIEQWNLKV
ncbi:hypothetical protein EON83_26835 [bacterium]|nr:MAG: hypothetical protein EON83_26835 [bacterium]